MYRPKLVNCLAIAVLGMIVNTSMGVIIGASDDTWVREDSDTNRNGDDQVNARTDSDGDRNDVILLRFPTTSLTASAVDATLSLYWYRSDTSTGKNLTLWGLNETATDETTWSESVVTYSTAPGMIYDTDIPSVEVGLGHTDDDVRDLDSANLTLLVENQAYGPTTVDEVYSFTSAALTQFINDDTNGEVTFLITRGALDTSSNQARFQTKEAGLSPNLTVVIPEPATLGLVGIFGAGVIFVRRRFLI